MAKAVMWMVRAGEGGYLFSEFRDRNSVAIGWNELNDLSSADTKEAIRVLYQAAYPDHNNRKTSNAIAMIYRFRSVLKPGDLVTTYDPETREYLVGTIKSDYRYDPTLKYFHVRTVAWQGTVDRDKLEPESRDTLGSIMTLFQLNEETAEDLLSVLQGKKSEVEAEDEKEDLEQLKEDIIGRAHELIKDKILKLNDEQLEHLVAAILRGMGYKTRVSPKGPDRGVDVFASPDGLGLEEPRIKAEVKHRPKERMGSQAIRSFLGGLRQGDRALYVSTGGYSKDARYEADRSNIPITLLNLDELATLVVTHYENFDMDGKVLIPLTRLFWPVD